MRGLRYALLLGLTLAALEAGVAGYAVVYRYLFIATIDVTKLFATIEEFLGVRMTWGKLERAGQL